MSVRGCVLGLILLYFAIPAESAFSFEDCSAGNSIIRFTTISITPDPIDLKQNLNVTFRGEIFQNIPKSAKVGVKIYRTSSIFGVYLDIPIPCLLGKYGSCELPLCEYMNHFKPHLEQFLPNEIAYECPPRAGNYGGENISIDTGAITIIGQFIAMGEYRTEISLTDEETGKELACFIFYIELI